MKKTLFFNILVCISLFSVVSSANIANKLFFTRKTMNKGMKAMTAANLQYLGGPVISNAKIVAVFWGPDVDNTVQSKIGDFYSTLTNSTYMDFLKEYDTNITAVTGHTGTNQAIGRGSFGGTFTITPSKTSSTIDDKDIQAELTSQIAANKLPTPDNNTIYMVSFPPGDTITMTQGGQTAQSCEEFCAYHSSTVVGSANIYYGVMPDLGGACSVGCGNSDQFGNYTSAASHEITEAITDPQVGDVPGNAVGYPMAWYDKNQGEIGDICVQTNGTVTATDGTLFVVQGEWSNSQKKCVTGPPANGPAL